jgi:hypothetical protein
VGNLAEICTKVGQDTCLRIDDDFLLDANLNQKKQKTKKGKKSVA